MVLVYNNNQYRIYTPKMAVMLLVSETKMADVGKLISLRNLLARKTTWLVLTTTSATSILSLVFGPYCMTKIVYTYSRLPTLILFHIFTYRVNTLFPLWLPERTLSHFHIWFPPVNRHENVYSLQQFSSLLYFFGETFSCLEHRNFV